MKDFESPQLMRPHTYAIPTMVGLTIISLLTFWGCTKTDRVADIQPTALKVLPSAAAAADGKPIPTNFHNPYTAFSLEDRMVLSNQIEQPSPPAPRTLGPLFSFRAHELPLIDALALFARNNKLNIVSGPEISGFVTVDFHDLPLEQAMSALLEAHGYYWEHHGDLIKVKQFKTRSLSVDYIRLIRGGTGQNRAQLNSGSSGTSDGGSQDNGQITVNQQDEIKFWEELEGQIRTLMSKDGRLVLNRLVRNDSSDRLVSTSG